MLKMYSVVVESNALGIEKAKAGITGRELDAICRSYIAQQFNGYNIPHGVGHGVGMLIHEEPRNKATNHQPLPANAVVTIEPGIYDVSVGGVRVEDTVVITKTGCRVLTHKAVK
jgi:Xaa-Pro aminopeptidase